MNGRAYEVITSSIRQTIDTFRQTIEESKGEVSISFEEVMNELVSTLESKMEENGMKTSQLWEDCGF